MICRICGNSLDDIAFIGGLCVDCYSQTVDDGRSPAGNLARKAAEGVRRAAEARRRRRMDRDTPKGEEGLGDA